MLTTYCIFVAKMKQDTMKKYLFILWTIVMTVTVNAQIMNPVHFTSELKTGEGAEAEIVFHATIDNGWHVYSTDLGDDGPIEATFNVVKMDGAEPVGKLIPKGKEITKPPSYRKSDSPNPIMRSTAIWNMVSAATPVVCLRRKWL